jgi:mannose-6-phosphate isomerase-like protein (cupin superfamily)
MIVIRAEDVKSRWTPPPHHRELKVLLSPALHDTYAGLSIGMVVLGPGESGDPHHHPTEQETWFIISGRGKLKVGNQEAELVLDSVIVAPAGVEHQIMSSVDEPLKALFIFTPAGPEEQYLPDE